jgi:hypothetical protein
MLPTSTDLFATRLSEVVEISMDSPTSTISSSEDAPEDLERSPAPDKMDVVSDLRDDGSVTPRSTARTLAATSANPGYRTASGDFAFRTASDGTAHRHEF